MQEKSFYITTPIYYVNDVPHIGHAYTTLITDIMARFMKLDGYEVAFVTGTDEHGQKVEKAAQSQSISPNEFANKTSKIFKDLANMMNYQYSDFVRTTEDRHKNAVEHLWKRLYEKHQIYLGVYSGWYSVRDETFYQEKELLNGKAPTGADVEWIEEPSYFFRLSEYQNKLLELYEQNKEFIFPQHRYNEVISFVKSGLKDLSISRKNLSWGIKVPNDPEHTVYVWIDALTNYLTALGFPDLQNKAYVKFWNSPSSMRVHVVGKDILRFHAIYWPAILMAAELPIPKKIVAHGWWKSDGHKMSKSLKNVIDPFKLIEQFGIDQLRYFLIREVQIGNDGNFSYQCFINCINSELVNNIGNLLQRTVVLLHKEFNGFVPNLPNELFVEEHSLPDYTKILNNARKFILNYDFHGFISIVLQLSSLSNDYIDKQKPWKICKTSNTTLLGTILYKLLENLRCIGMLLQPIIVQVSLLDHLNIPVEERSFNYFANRMKGGTLLPKPTIIFSRIQSNSVVKEKDKD